MKGFFKMVMVGIFGAIGVAAYIALDKRITSVEMIAMNLESDLDELQDILINGCNDDADV